jgi:hypothetical protein
MSMFEKWEEEDREEIVETLTEQLEIEGQLVGLYEEYEHGTENKALKRVMQMFRLDSQRHINILEAVVEVIEGEDVLIEDKKDLKESLVKHLELEAEAIKMANKVLGKQIINETLGLKMLLEIWRDDEKRHHKALKELSTKTFYQLGFTDMVALFRDEEFLEERYLKARQFKEKMSQTG